MPALHPFSRVFVMSHKSSGNNVDVTIFLFVFNFSPTSPLSLDGLPLLDRFSASPQFQLSPAPAMALPSTCLCASVPQIN